MAGTPRRSDQVGGTPTKVLVERVGAVDVARLGRRVGTLDAVARDSVDEALRVVLRLD